MLDENDYLIQEDVFMRRALALAHEAELDGEVPVGAVVVAEGKIIGEGRNQMISWSDPSAHAEIVALRDAARKRGNYRLPQCDLYVTIEPCTMCFGAMIHSRIARIIFGAKEPRAGMLLSNTQLSTANFYNHQLNWKGGVLEQECAALMSRFFRSRRG